MDQNSTIDIEISAIDQMICKSNPIDNKEQKSIYDDVIQILWIMA